MKSTFLNFFSNRSRGGLKEYFCIQFFEHCEVSGLHHQRHLTEMRNARQSPSLMPMVWKKIHDPPQYYFEHNGQTYLFKMEIHREHFEKKVIKKYHAYIIWQNVGSVIMESYEFEYDKKTQTQIEIEIETTVGFVQMN